MPHSPHGARRRRRVAATVLLALAASAALAAALVPLAAGESGRRAAARAALLRIDPARQPYRFGGRGAGAFNEPIPARARTDRRSRRVVAAMLASMRRERVALVDRNGVPGVWHARRGDPWFTVRIGRARVRWQVPRGARPGADASSDAPLVIQDPRHPRYGSRVELRLWQASMDRGSRTISARGYGIFRYGRNSNGYPLRGHGTGSGLPWAGLIRAWEARRGVIRHALRMAASGISRRHRRPALGSDQRHPGPLAMGMRFQLSPRVNCRSRTVPGRSGRSRETRLLRAICVALQRYGAIVVDGSGRSDLYTFEMELDRSAGGAVRWSRVAGRPPGGYWGNLIRDRRAGGDGVRRVASTGIPWGRMRVLAHSVFSR